MANKLFELGIIDLFDMKYDVIATGVSHKLHAGAGFCNVTSANKLNIKYAGGGSHPSL